MDIKGLDLETDKIVIRARSEIQEWQRQLVASFKRRFVFVRFASPSPASNEKKRAHHDR
jgi:hypothetical protein